MHKVEDLTVIKRSGQKVPYERGKIQKAVESAFTKVYNGDMDKNKHDAVIDISLKVENILRGRRAKKTEVETIQDIVSNQIMASGYPEAAREYVLFRHEKQKLRNMRMNPDAGALADFIAVSKYSRYREDLQRRETWEEAVKRVRDMHIRRFPHIKEDITRAFEHVINKRVLCAGRHMQFGGKAIEEVNSRAYNCSMVPVDTVDKFSKIMYLLLSGAGVGFDNTFECVEKLPSLADKIDFSKVKHFTIPDTIQGWADAVQELLTSYLKGYFVEFNYSQIRPKGSPLKTSGGIAPGHYGLRTSLEKIRSALDKALGRKLRPIETFDLIMYISEAVLSGGVRRAAALGLFSPDDGEMMNAKTDNWFNENPQRSRANISVKLVRDETSKAQFKRIIARMKEYGEPGFYLTDNSQYCINPCAEASSRPYLDNGTSGIGFCNLTEINGAVMRSEREFKAAARSAALIGTLQAAYIDFPYLGKITEEIAKRDALIGVSITGILDNPEICLDYGIQSRIAEYIKEVNEEVAEKIGINPAKRCTCVKPSGTASKLLGSVSTGITPRWAHRYFNRIQCNRDEAPYQHFHKYNPHACEKSIYNPDRDDIITFCIQGPEKGITWDDVSAVEMLDIIRNTQNAWVKHGTRDTSEEGLTHSVSNTVLVREEEWEEAAEYIWKYKDELVGVTLLPRDTNKYPQAPLERISNEEDELKWRHIIEKYRPVDYTEMKESEDRTILNQTVECDGAGCSLK